jgi:hypothetical protein
MQKPLRNCPVCSGELTVTRLSCRSCQIDISGEFAWPGTQWELDQELRDFIKVFIYAEGSIKQSEKLLNCSYPKIKNLLKKTKAALGFKKQEETMDESVINLLDRGEINVEEALQQLRRKQ